MLATEIHLVEPMGFNGITYINTRMELFTRTKANQRQLPSWNAKPAQNTAYKHWTLHTCRHIYMYCILLAQLFYTARLVYVSSMELNIVIPDGFRDIWKLFWVFIYNLNHLPYSLQKTDKQQHILQASPFCIHYELFDSEKVKHFNEKFPTLVTFVEFFWSLDFIS